MLCNILMNYSRTYHTNHITITGSLDAEMRVCVRAVRVTTAKLQLRIVYA